MNIILCESNKYPIGSFIDKVKEKFPKSSILNCNKDNLMDVRKMIASPPVLTKGWLVLVFIRGVDSTIISSLSSKENLIIYVTRNIEEQREISVEFDLLNLEYRVVNNMDLDYNVLIDYVQSELDVDYELAKRLVNRYSYGSRDNKKVIASRLFENVERLRDFKGKITSKIITQYTEKYSDISFNAFFDYIIGVRDLNHKKVVELVIKYRYGINFLMKYVIDKMEIYIKVYNFITRGQLSLENYKEFLEQNRSEFNKVGEYTIRKAVEAFELVSFDKLYNMYYLYKKEYEDGCKITRVLTLLKLSEKGED